MKIIRYLLAYVIPLSLMMTGGCIGDGNNKNITGDEGNTSTLAIEETQVPIAGIHMVIDKSASMKGYFQNQNKMQGAIQSVLGLVPDEKSDIRFSGEKNILKGSTAANILANSKFDKNTDMQALIDECITLGDDSVPVVLVTDGIVSTAQGKNDLPETERKIESLLKHKQTDLSWLILRGEGDYSGTYYIENDRPKSYPKVDLSTEARPFFIIVIGPKPQMRTINEEISKKQNSWKSEWNCEWLAFNTHDNHSTLKFYQPDNTYFDENGKFKTLNDQNAMIPLWFNYPSCLANSVKGLSSKNATLEINGTVIKGWRSAKTENGTIQIDFPGRQLAENLKGDNKLSLSFSTLPDDKWSSDYNSDDDSTIVTDQDQQKRTFKLSSLLTPMREASSNNEVIVSFSFTD